jgi:glucose/arabinose dehydrogenase
MAAAAACMTLLGAMACGGDDDTGNEKPVQGKVDRSVSKLADVGVKLTSIGKFEQPIAVVPRPDDTALYVAGFNGTVTKVNVTGSGASRKYQAEAEPVLDIDKIVTTGGERGFLDIAFSPDGKRLYVSYSAEPDGTSVVASYAFDGGKVDTSTRKQIIEVKDFAPNHNGGDITFGPDGYLYFAMGDGGGAGDPEKNGQDTESLLGKVMRLDPESTADSSEPYAIPPDNPFVGGKDGKPEIWLYGVRNPWRFSFDSKTKDLWIGDVGQDTWEEIDWLPASKGGGKGANLGWSEMEGAHSFNGGSEPKGAVTPIYEYKTHEDDTCAVTGGVLYHGKTAPGFDGAYLFGDSCQNKLRAIRIDGDGKVVDEARYDDAEVTQLVSFGTDNGGDAYVVGLGAGEVYRIDA